MTKQSAHGSEVSPFERFQFRSIRFLKIRLLSDFGCYCHLKSVELTHDSEVSSSPSGQANLVKLALFSAVN